MYGHDDPVKTDVSEVLRLLVSKLLKNLEVNLDRNKSEFTYIDEDFTL